ncbi:copper chaperone [Lichenibacterium minor]|uniref:Copper chaperone n=1 Tax=Lichenibacterium minor TaxID=2316528 RepID=A0A4V1RUJ2_9HYPH|nr:heavy-metal-associated domain-containing protein [Lichenibacterium minor]RYC31344.1 copper chaperone [Lichenibacterium minor]
MLNFKVEKMTCGHCVRAVTEAVHGVDAGAHVDVDLKAGRVAVATEDAGSADRIAAAIRAAGYDAAPVGASA